MRGGLRRQIHDGASLLKWVVGCKVKDVEEVKVRPDKTIGEVIEVLLAVDIETYVEAVAPTGVVHVVLVQKVVLRPARRPPLGEVVADAADVIDIWKRRDL